MGLIGHLISLFLRWRCPGKLARLLLMLPFKAVRSHYGPLLLNVRNDRTFRFCATGAYGDFISSRLQAIGRDFAFLDVGANVGVFSLVAARNPHCQGVFAFEPNPDTYAFLVRNIRLNRAAKVAPICAAITDRGGACSELWTPEQHSGRASLDPARRGQGEMRLVLNADRRLLNCLSRWVTCDVVAKIDVEGHEPEVLAELLNSELGAKLTDVIVEISHRRREDRADEMVRLLERFGFAMTGSGGPGQHFDAHFTRPRAAALGEQVLPMAEARPRDRRRR